MFWFNRTFMELKQHTLQLSLKLNEGFNRTFMELKLIIPWHGTSKEIWFNRTFMELNPTIGTMETALMDGLIVPLWN